MGRGDRAKVRWHNDRVNKKKARDKRRASEGGRPAAPAQAPAAVTASAPAAGGAEASSAPAADGAAES